MSQKYRKPHISFESIEEKLNSFESKMMLEICVKDQRQLPFRLTVKRFNKAIYLVQSIKSNVEVELNFYNQKCLEMMIMRYKHHLE